MSKTFFKYFSQIALVVFLMTALFFNSGCSSRKEKPVVLDDSTIVYPAKSETGVQPTIALANKISKKSGKPLNAGTVFRLKENTKLYALIDLENKTNYNQRELMFHVDWLDSSGNSFFRKQINLTSSDSSSQIISSINLEPGKRQKGNYRICVYLFRELIAEKNFQILEAKTDYPSKEKKNFSSSKKKSVTKEDKKKKIKPKVKIEDISADMTLCRGVSKKTGKLIGVDSIFTIKDKGKVKAVAKIENRDIKTNQQMSFYFEWIGPDGKPFYKKKLVYTTSNPSFTISNSITIAPGKRDPGFYTLRVHYKKKIIAEQKFELVVPKK